MCFFFQDCWSTWKDWNDVKEDNIKKKLWRYVEKQRNELKIEGNPMKTRIEKLENEPDHCIYTTNYIFFFTYNWTPPRPSRGTSVLRVFLNTLEANTKRK